MKKTSALLLILLLIAVTAFATGKKEKSNQYKNPVIVHDIGFNAVYKNGSVQTTWKQYLRDDLKYYKVVRSNSNPDPVYPDDSYIFYSSDPRKTSYIDNKKLTPGTWYYRVCIITTNADRWVSPVIKINVNQTQSGPPSSKDFK